MLTRSLGPCPAGRAQTHGEGVPRMRMVTAANCRKDPPAETWADTAGAQYLRGTWDEPQDLCGNHVTYGSAEILPGAKVKLTPVRKAVWSLT